MERKDGYYWIKYLDKWIISEYRERGYTFHENVFYTFDFDPLFEKDIEEIDETPIVKPKK